MKSAPQEKIICKTASQQGKNILATKPNQEGCRYHFKKTEIFTPVKLSPQGLCIHAFHAVYSSCLKILYTKNNNNEISISCPEAEGLVEFDIIGISHSNIIERILNTLKYYLRIMGIPCDYQIKRVFIKVRDVKKSCPMGYCKGDIFEFNLGKNKEICPASFEAIYPTVYSLNLTQQLVPEDSGKNNNACLQCPSRCVSINYTI